MCLVVGWLQAEVLARCSCHPSGQPGLVHMMRALGLPGAAKGHVLLYKCFLNDSTCIMFAAVPLAQGSPELVWKRNTKGHG